MAFVLFLFGIAALVWGLIYVRGGSLWIGGVAFLLVGYVLNHYFTRWDFGPATLTLGRIMLAGLVLLFCWRWWCGETARRPLTGSDWLAALFIGYLSIRYLLTESPVGFVSSVSPTWKLVASFWMPAALYFVIRHVQLNERHWKIVLVSLTGLGTYLAATAIAEVHEQWWAVFPRFIADPKLGTHFGRARGPALMSASLGVYLAVCFWAAWFLWSHVNRYASAVLVGLMLLMIVGLYYTFTRSTWLGLAAGLAVIPFLQFPRAWRPVLLCGGLLAGCLTAVAVGDKVINMGREDADGSASHSVYQRASFAYVSLQMFLDAPLVGHGFGRFYDAKLPYLADRSQQIELESLRNLDHHNTYLSILTETGVIGFLLFIALLVAWLRLGWRVARNRQLPGWMRSQGLFALATMIVYLTNAMFHDLTLSPSEQWLLCLVMGGTVAIFSMSHATQSTAAVLSLRLRENHPWLATPG